VLPAAIGYGPATPPLALSPLLAPDRPAVSNRAHAPLSARAVPSSDTWYTRSCGTSGRRPRARFVCIPPSVPLSRQSGGWKPTARKAMGLDRADGAKRPRPLGGRARDYALGVRPPNTIACRFQAVRPVVGKRVVKRQAAVNVGRRLPLLFVEYWGRMCLHDPHGRRESRSSREVSQWFVRSRAETMSRPLTKGRV